MNGTNGNKFDFRVFRGFSSVPLSVFILCMAVLPVAGQVVRRIGPVARPAQTETEERQVLRPQPPEALVYVQQTIDLSAQLGSEENLMTLDGEPLPPMLTKNVTLGLVIDELGHVVTRLVGVTPMQPPREVIVTPQRGRPTPARFIGLDSATGLCVLQVEGPGFTPPLLVAEDYRAAQLAVNVFGFNAALVQTQSPTMGFFRPRIHLMPGRIAPAAKDFRFKREQPLYRLLTPQLTPIQDGSLAVAADGSVFGIAVHDTTEDGHNLVYSVARVRSIAAAVIEARGSLAHGWLGATGVTLSGAPSPQRTQGDAGVRITGVFPDSPAEHAGIQTQDVLLAINDRSITSVEQLGGALRRLSADSEVTLRVRRGREYKTLQAKLAPAPALESGQQLTVFARQLRAWEEKLRVLEPGAPERREIEPKVTAMRAIMDNILGSAPAEVKLRVRYGIEIQPLTTQLMRYFSVPGGVLTTTVVEGSRASRAGLRAGDVIITVGNAAASASSPLSDAGQLLRLLDESGDGEIQISLVRQRESLSITLPR